MRNRLPLAATALLAFALALPGLGDPPGHAPAHGWRKKHDPYYVGYTGRHWPDDYGIRSGRCDRERVGTALGAVLGGAVGAAVSDRDDRLVAVLVGAALGAIIGREIGSDMDDRDRACIGHALELQRDGAAVAWAGSGPRVAWQLTPGARFNRDGHVCRSFLLVREKDGHRLSRGGKACRVGEGDWQLVES